MLSSPTSSPLLASSVGKVEHWSGSKASDILYLVATSNSTMFVYLVGSNVPMRLHTIVVREQLS